MANASLQVRVVRDYRFPLVGVEWVAGEYFSVRVLFGFVEWGTAGAVTVVRVAGAEVYNQVGSVKRCLGFKWGSNERSDS